MCAGVALASGGGSGGDGIVGRRGGNGGGDSDGEPEGFPIGWPFAVPLLHAMNKGLLCASVAPELRDLVMRVTDVGFLGALGGVAALTSLASSCGYGGALGALSLAIVQVGLGHMLFESLVNGILLPLFRNPEKARKPLHFTRVLHATTFTPLPGTPGPPARCCHS